MNLGIISYKGGVGKTTVSANLASHLAALGLNVHALDMDDQNALRLHFSVDPQDTRGISSCSSPSDWKDVGIYHDSGVTVYPHGSTSFSNRQSLNKVLRESPSLLKMWSDHYIGEQSLLLVDTPPGGDVFAQQAIVSADFLLVVLNADGASFATLGTMKESIAFFNADLLSENRVFFLVNGYDERRELDKSVLVVMKDVLGKQLSPIVIHNDTGLRDAMAQQQLIINYDPASQANAEFSELAQWLMNEVSYFKD